MVKQTKKVYILELIGDTHNSGGSVTLEIGGVSTDKKVLEKLMVKKDKELDDEFEGENDEIDENDHSDYEYTYQNTDLSDRPMWCITEHKLLK